MRHASGHNYRNSSFIVDVAMGQIPRSTERISNSYTTSYSVMPEVLQRLSESCSRSALTCSAACSAFIKTLYMYVVFIRLYTNNQCITKCVFLHTTISLLDPATTQQTSSTRGRDRRARFVSSDRFPFRRHGRPVGVVARRGALSTRDKANWQAAFRSLVATTSQRDDGAPSRTPVTATHTNNRSHNELFRASLVD